MTDNCASCGAPGATETWELQPCALDGAKIEAALCGRCDIALNEAILTFFGLPDRDEIMRRYRARHG